MNKENEVVYRKSKTWQIALAMMNNGCAMCFYILVTYASYVANVGYGVATAVVGVILTVTRIWDAITDPLVGMMIEKTNTKFGKIRIWLVLGWLLESLAVLMLYSWASGKGHSTLLFIVLYLVYVVGYTMNNMAGLVINPVLTNDPKQRPTVGVWGTVYSYFVPMIFSGILMMVVLPKYNNEYTVEMLSESAYLCVGISFIFLLLSCIGISHADKPENFVGLKNERVKFKEMIQILKENKNLRMFILAATSDKLAQQVASNSIVTTMLYGILIGNMQLSTKLSIMAMLPSIIFAILGAKYAGKHGNKEANVTWTRACLIFCAVILVFYGVIDMRSISTSMIMMIVYFATTLLLNGMKMCVTTATTAMLADVTDYELLRSGNYLPAVVSGTYNFVDKLVTSISALIATGCVALIGYTTTMPQPTDSYSNSIKVVCLFLFYVLPILGWICTLIAMRKYDLTKERMVDIQKEIEVKKAESKEAE